MSKLLKRVRYLALQKKIWGLVDYKGTTNMNSQRHSNKISSPDRTKEQYLSETER